MDNAHRDEARDKGQTDTAAHHGGAIAHSLYMLHALSMWDATSYSRPLHGHHTLRALMLSQACSPYPIA